VIPRGPAVLTPTDTISGLSPHLAMAFMPQDRRRRPAFSAGRRNASDAAAAP
jgi:hypothetical protein